MVAQNRGAGSRGRGRPGRTVGRLLSRDQIAEKTLEIAGAEGFRAVTMHRLARELDVTPRALYNHVRDRQDVIDLTATLMLQQLPTPELDAESWRESLRGVYQQMRSVYRKFPRSSLISLDERVTPAGVDPQRILLTEQILQFFVDIGLSLDQAITLRTAFLLDLFSFTLLVDYAYDQACPELQAAMVQPVPAIWLAAHPEIEAPLAMAATQITPPTSDQMFEAIVDLRIAAIESMLSATPAPRA